MRKRWGQVLKGKFFQIIRVRANFSEKGKKSRRLIWDIPSFAENLEHSLILHLNCPERQHHLYPPCHPYIHDVAE